MSCKSILQEEAIALRDAIGTDDSAAARRQMTRLSSLLPQLMKGYCDAIVAAKKRSLRRTPRWMFIGDILDCLNAAADSGVADGWVPPCDVRSWIERIREYTLTLADISRRQKNGRGNTIASWWDETLWLKRIILQEGLVSDNGRRGRASRWHITDAGTVMLLKLRAAARAERDEIASSWYQKALSNYLPKTVRA